MEREEEIIESRKKFSDRIITQSEDNRMRNTLSVETTWKEWSNGRLKNPPTFLTSQSCLINSASTRLELRTHDTYPERINLIKTAAEKENLLVLHSNDILIIRDTILEKYLYPGNPPHSYLDDFQTFENRLIDLSVLDGTKSVSGMLPGSRFYDIVNAWSLSKTTRKLIFIGIPKKYKKLFFGAELKKNVVDVVCYFSGKGMAIREYTKDTTPNTFDLIIEHNYPHGPYGITSYNWSEICVGQKHV